MNLDHALDRADAAVRDAQKIRDQIAEAISNTNDILSAAEMLGVRLVGIGARDNRFMDSKGHPFVPNGSIFANGRKDGWPIAWEVAEKSGLSGGAGNPGQHQISGPTINGIYEFKDGAWRKSDTA